MRPQLSHKGAQESKYGSTRELYKFSRVPWGTNGLVVISNYSKIPDPFFYVLDQCGFPSSSVRLVPHLSIIDVILKFRMRVLAMPDYYLHCVQSNVPQKREADRAGVGIYSVRVRVEVKVRGQAVEIVT